MDTGSLLSVDDAARQLSLTPQQVRNLCRDGKLNAQKVGGSWVIDSSCLVLYSVERPLHKVAEDRVRYDVGKPSKPVALSFFSGAMGLDLGLEQAGFDVLLASEIDPACRLTIATNRPETALLGDIGCYSSDDIMHAAGLTPGRDEVDLVVGGPPCQGFSTAGKRQSFQDDRGNVFLQYIRLALELLPKYIVIENVRGILSAPLLHRPHIKRGEGHDPLKEEELPGGALLYVVNMIRERGYSVSFNLYNAANFGVPQIRERVVIICARDGSRVPYLTPSHAQDGSFDLPMWKTFREAVADLPGSPKDFVEFPEKRLRYYKMLGPGQNWRDLPTDLQQEALGQSYFAGGGKTGFYRRLAWDKPSPTLVTYPAMPATDLAHPVEDRPLSVQEYMRIQEFPDGWYLAGAIRDRYRQIGNAVPVGLGRAIGRALLDHMDGVHPPEFLNYRYSRYTGTDEVSWQGQMARAKKPKKAAEERAVQYGLPL